MQKYLWAALSFVALTFISATSHAGQTPESFADLAERLLPTVVNVSTTQTIGQTSVQNQQQMPQFPPGSPFEDFFRDFFEQYQNGAPNGAPRKASSLGSGFIIDAKEGYIVTNNHVIKDADEIKVTLADDTTHDAEIIGTDEKTDLAVLKIKAEIKLTDANWGHSDKMRVGDWVMAVGNPFGLGGTVTAGIISARQRNINAGPYDDFLQTDASINRGNSGGPMFDTDGNVIGVNTAIFSPSGGSVGIGFAVPSDLARPVVEQLIKYGKTRRGWIGVRIQHVTDEIAEGLGLDEATGALVASLTKDGPAEKAGLEAGDVIIEFNNQPIDEMRALPRIVAETEIDAKVPVKISRKGKVMTKTIKLGQLEKAEENGLLASATKETDKNGKIGTELEGLGITVAGLTPDLRNEYSIDETAKGLVITEIGADSSAASKGVLIGDIIVEIDQNPIASIKDITAHLKKAEKDGRSSILFLLDRGGDLRFVAVKLKEKSDG